MNPMNAMNPNQPSEIEPIELLLPGLSALMQDTLVRRGNKLSLQSDVLKQPQVKANWDEMSLEKIRTKLTRAVGQAIGDFDLINDGDRIMVAISGGKDSWALLDILNDMQKKAPVDFKIIAVNIDQGYSGFRQDVVEEYVRKNNFEYHMEFFDIAAIIEEKNKPGDTPCSLCARLRRGSLYGLAEKYNCNKIALGHHQDDFIETLLLNSFFVGRLASMAPKLISDDQKNVVIRPLVYASEAMIKSYVTKMGFPVICCQCPIMCGETVHGDYKRRMIKKLIDQLELVIPNIRDSLLASLGNIQPSHLLDKDLWNFKTPANLSAQKEQSNEANS
jgi:tRNA 2-thiocytidine biosynthesis protein TtcA